VDVELAVPLSKKDGIGFGKVDAFMAKRFSIVPDKLNLVWTTSGGFMQPLFG
jgi:hypothetical protein